jgi:hypothetical protein
LAELDARRLYLGLGFSSLFTYCTEALRLSEHGAYNRIEAARAARRFPAILERLAEGSLNLATVRLLAPHLTPANQDELLAAACGKRKRAVEELVVRHFPRPDVADSIRKLPPPRPALPEGAGEMGTSPPESPVVPPAAATLMAPPCVASSSTAPAVPAPSAPAPSAPAPRHPVLTPLAPDRYQIRFTASAATCEKLRLAQDLLRHAIPSGDTAQIIDRALTALLEELARTRFGATERPRERPCEAGESRVPAAAGSRHIPAAVKRAVWLRDGGRCAFVARSGRRCGERGFLEFHHAVPYAVGGAATVDNIQMRCRSHNAHEAELYFGAG